jgi:hypothetical protein
MNSVDRSVNTKAIAIKSRLTSAPDGGATGKKHSCGHYRENARLVTRASGFTVQGAGSLTVAVRKPFWFATVSEARP